MFRGKLHATESSLLAVSYVEKVHNESYGLFYRVDLGVCLVAGKPLFEFPFVCFFVRSHVRNVCALVRSPVHPFIPVLVSAFIRYFVCAFVRSFLRSFVTLCVRLFVRWGIHYSFLRSIDRSFVPLLLCVCLGLFISAVFYSSIRLFVCVKVFFFLSINSFLSYTNVLPDFRIVYDRMTTRTSWMKSLRSLRTPT